MSIQPPQQQNPKVTQFLEEITEVSDRYQYTLAPVLSMTESGIKPVIKVVDKIPEKKVPKVEVKKTKNK